MDHKLKKWALTITCLSMTSGLMGCGDKQQAVTGQTTGQTADKATVIDTATADSKSVDLSVDLPDNAPAVGTDIATLVPEKTKQSTSQNNSPNNNADVVNLRWEDLTPKGYEPDKILAKFREKIDALPEGAPEERALLQEVQAALNSAPVNNELNGKKIKLPGFVSPLDENNGMVTEFLLVPYFGACIHAPPPPLNQTLLVKPQKDKSVSMDKIYEPVWVTGTLSTEGATTDLAQAGYVIDVAEVTPYEGDVGADY